MTYPGIDSYPHPRPTCCFGKIWLPWQLFYYTYIHKLQFKLMFCIKCSLVSFNY